MTIPSPSEPEDPKREPRPYPCPECESTQGYNRVGRFRSQCRNCNSLLTNAEINLEDLTPQ